MLIDFTIENCLKKEDACNKGFFYAKKAIGYAFLGKTKEAKKAIDLVSQQENSCIQPPFVKYYKAMASYFLASSQGIENDVDTYLAQMIDFAGQMKDNNKLAMAYGNRASHLASKGRDNLALEMAIKGLEYGKNSGPNFYTWYVWIISRN